MIENGDEIYDYPLEERRESNEEHEENEKDEEWVQLNKKETRTNDGKKIAFIFFSMYIGVLIFLIGVIINYHLKYDTKKTTTIDEKISITKHEGNQEEKNTVTEYEEDGSFDDVKGFWAGYDFLNVRKDIVTLYKGDLITYEQLQEYVEAYLNIVNSIQNKEDLSLTIIEKYNQAIKKIDLINYDTYRIKESKTFIGFFSEYLKVCIYESIVTYYHNLKQIPDEKYNAFEIITSKNRMGNIERIADYTKELIEEYVGNLDEILTSVEWRHILSIEDFFYVW